MHRRLARTPSDVAASKRSRRVRGKQPERSAPKLLVAKRPATRTQARLPEKNTDEEEGGEAQQDSSEDEQSSLHTSNISISTSSSDSSSSSSSRSRSTSNKEAASVGDADAPAPAVEDPSNNQVVPAAEGSEANQSQATQNTEHILSDPWMK